MRPIICLTELSRSGLDMRPRKYFCATMFVAVCDQNFGNSTFFCSNAGPFFPGMWASRDLPLDLVERVAAPIVNSRRTARLASSSTTLLTSSSGWI